MDDLIAFLKAQLDEDEASARQAPGPTWEHRQIRDEVGGEIVVFEDYIAVADPDRNTVVLSDVDDDVRPFVLRHDPARVLRDVEAKRRLLQRAESDLADDQWDEAAQETVKVLALPYADREGYREEWRP